MPSAETGLRLVEAEIDEDTLLNGLMDSCRERSASVVAMEDSEGVAVDKIGGGRRQPDHAGVEVVDDLGEPVEERAMRFVEDDQVEEAWAELRVAEAERLLGGDEEALRPVDVVGEDPVAWLVRQERLEPVGEGLVDERVAVCQEEDVLGLMRPQKSSMSAIVVRVLPVPVAITRSARRLPLANASPTLRIASCW